MYSTIGNRFYFTGRELYEETGLYHYRARAYLPQIGRFLQRDPYTWGPDDLRLINFHLDYELSKVLIDNFGLKGTRIEQALNLIHKIPSLINHIGTTNPSLLHLYMYVGNSSVNWIDPFGFDKQLIQEQKRLELELLLKTAGFYVGTGGALIGIGIAIGWTPWGITFIAAGILSEVRGIYEFIDWAQRYGGWYRRMRKNREQEVLGTETGIW